MKTSHNDKTIIDTTKMSVDHYLEIVLHCSATSFPVYDASSGKTPVYTIYMRKVKTLNTFESAADNKH